MADEFAWRKKELHAIKSLVIANEGTRQLDLHIGGGVTLLYAHWEGFIKEIGRSYLEFVGRRRLKHEQLSEGFLAMAIGRMLRSASNGRIESSIAVIRFFQDGLGKRSELPWRAGIDTKSNLNSEVFREIVMSLGLDYSLFETKEKLLDEKLLGNRNEIAHGKRLLVDFDEYLSLHDDVFGMMQTFYNLVDNRPQPVHIGPLPPNMRPNSPMAATFPMAIHACVAPIALAHTCPLSRHHAH